MCSLSGQLAWAGATVCQGVEHQVQTVESEKNTNPVLSPWGPWLFPLAGPGGEVWVFSLIHFTHSLIHSLLGQT